ncbi:MAG: tetratricopeptide repeat protein [Verrucomicrobiia bacterium]
MNDTAGENRALALAPSSVLERAGPAALAMRGLRDLLALQQADAWLQKGRELQELNSYTEAVDCFNRGLEVDPEHSILQFYLGLAYYDGDGVSLDYSLAFTWFRKAAEQGYTMGQTGLGLLYNGGWGVPQDYRVAAAWYQKSAEQGDVTGQILLGDLYEEGNGVPQDYGLAVDWYRKAAEQGDEWAIATLADLYHEGQKVPQDYAQAMAWYSKGAE